MAKTLLFGQFTYGGFTMDNYCEPIIDKNTFDNLQVYNKFAPAEHEKPLGHFSKNRPLLSNMLYCGICGKKAFLNRRTAKGHLYETYYCNDKHIGFRREILDSLVIEKGAELLSDEQYQKAVSDIVDSLKSMNSDGMDDNSTLTAEIAKIDRKIARISSVIEDSDESPVTLVKRLSELEKERADLVSQMQTDDDSDARNQILKECDRIRKYIVDVLKNEKSTTDELRNALSLFVHSVIIYPEGKVMIRYTLPGFAPVVSTTSGEVTAPPPDKRAYSQLFEAWCFV